MFSIQSHDVTLHNSDTNWDAVHAGLYRRILANAVTLFPEAVRMHRVSNVTDEGHSLPYHVPDTDAFNITVSAAPKGPVDDSARYRAVLTGGSPLNRTWLAEGGYWSTQTSALGALMEATGNALDSFAYPGREADLAGAFICEGNGGFVNIKGLKS